MLALRNSSCQSQLAMACCIVWSSKGRACGYSCLCTWRLSRRESFLMWRH
uniref:Uncharacterized protein n=1 Tax=Arundo donax TaxID=35708 RepID=A0A0A9FMH6_ARUDO